MTKDEIESLIQHLDYASEIDELPAKHSLRKLFDDYNALRQKCLELEKERDEALRAMSDESWRSYSA